MRETRRCDTTSTNRVKAAGRVRKQAEARLTVAYCSASVPPLVGFARGIGRCRPRGVPTRYVNQRMICDVSSLNVIQRHKHITKSIRAQILTIGVSSLGARIDTHEHVHLFECERKFSLQVRQELLSTT